MAEDRREAFYNKIFFCDVIGYSRLDPQGQFECQRGLTRVLGDVLARLGCGLGEDVIALPTGDGVVLNFLAPDPDIHLRAAMLSLEGLAASEQTVEPIRMRVGLNSHVDTWVLDINGQKNVVGSGINMAQRVMDLGAHGQILMHDRVRHDLASYPQYASNVVFCGNYRVKHGVEVPVAQFVDGSRSYISSEIRVPPSPAGSHQVLDLDAIIRGRVHEEILTLRLDPRAAANLAVVYDYVETFLDDHHAAQRLKVSAAWVVEEMLANAFGHNALADDSQTELKVGLTKTGLRVAVSQPDAEGFQLSEVLARSGETASFMQLMHGRGLIWDEHRRDGFLEIGLELPLDLDLNLMPALDLGSVIASGAPLRDASAPGRSEVVVAPVRLGRVDQANVAEFERWLDDRLQFAQSKDTALVLDLSGMDYISSRGLRVLAKLHHRAGSRVPIALCSPSRRVSEVLSITRFDRILRVFPDQGAAIRSLSAR